MLKLEHLPTDVGAGRVKTENRQTRKAFAAEASAIGRHHRSIVWMAPRRDESAAAPASQTQEPEILGADSDDLPGNSHVATTIQGGRERGLILHKLIEVCMVRPRVCVQAFASREGAGLRECIRPLSGILGFRATMSFARPSPNRYCDLQGPFHVAGFQDAG